MFCWFRHWPWSQHNSGLKGSYLLHLLSLQDTDHGRLDLRNTSQHFSTTLGGRFKYWHHQQEVQKRWRSPGQTRGGHAMAAAAPEAQGRAVPFGAQPDTRVSGQQNQSLCRSAHIWETGKVLRVLIWGLLINFSRQTNSQNSQRQHHERGWWTVTPLTFTKRIKTNTLHLVVTSRITKLLELNWQKWSHNEKIKLIRGLRFRSTQDEVTALNLMLTNSNLKCTQ